MKTILLLFVGVYLIPYIGITILNLFSSFIRLKNYFDLYLFGFAVGQIVLIKVFTVLGIFGLIYTDNILISVTLIFLLSVLYDYRKKFLITDTIKGVLFLGINKFKENNFYVIGVVFFMLIVFLVDLNSPRHADVLRYHLAYSNYIFSTHGLPFLEHNQLALAMDAELLFAISADIFGIENVKVIVFVNLIFCLFAMIAFVSLFKNVNRYYYSALFLLSPIIFLAATLEKPDIIQLFYFSLSIFLLYYFYVKKVGYSYIFLAAIFLGEVLALKWTGVIPIATLVCFVIYLAFFKKIDYKNATVILGLIGIFSLIMPLYWYLRNYIETGSPMWPLLTKLFLDNDGTLLYEIATTPSSRTDIIAHYSFIGYLFYTFFIYKPSVLGGIGVASYLLTPLGIFKEGLKKTYHLLVFILIYILLWYFAKASFRHLIWLVPIILVLSTSGLSYIFNDIKKKILKVFVISLLLVQVLFILIYSSMYVKHTLGFMNDLDYFKTTPNYEAFQKITQDINDKDSIILSIIPGSELFYFKQHSIDGNYRSSAIIDYKKLTTTKLLKKKINQLGIDYILYDENLIKHDYYIVLRKIIDENAIETNEYSSENLVNRLTGETIIVNLKLIKLSKTQL